MPTYVIGHKNPDTDAICSALGYADFLFRSAQQRVIAARCGEITERTAFALKKAGLAPPELVTEVYPTAGQICQRDMISASNKDSILSSFQIMRSREMRTIPVLDTERRMLGTLSALKMVDLLLPDSKDKAAARIVETSLSRIQASIGGKVLLAVEMEREQSFTMVVAALSERTFQDRLKNYQLQNTLVVSGDREAIHQMALEAGVRCLIIIGESTLPPVLMELARARGCAVLTSPFDTATTTLLIKCSKHITEAIDTEFISFAENTPLEQILTEIEDRDLPLFPVLDEAQRLLGTFTKADLIDPPRTKLILVDHNEFTQAVNGAEQAEIIEVIDHHRLGGGLRSKLPIRFLNEPVGSTCTIVANLYRQADLSPEPSIALVLAAGIISDTLNLSSPTATPLDGDILAWLQTHSPLDFKEFAEDFFAAGSLLKTLSPEQVVQSDCKEFSENGWRFAASQIEEQSLDSFWPQEEVLRQALESLRLEKTLDFACLLVTDITKHSSVMIYTGHEAMRLAIDYPPVNSHLFKLAKVVSRKKQLLPYLTSLLTKLKR
jgi:manganese-dependent inorganic pyrophosphatase